MTILKPEERETLIELIWGAKVQRYRMPVNIGIRRLVKRSIMGRCTQCGRDKINFRGADGCPVHDLTPGFREQDYPVNPKH